MRITRLLVGAVILAGGLGFQQAASAQDASGQIGTITQYASYLSTGVWYFNHANGKMSFCVTRALGINSSPTGKCSNSVAATTSATGFAVQPHDNSLWVTSKSTKGVYQCAAYVAHTTHTPEVKCALISNLSSLN